MVCRTTWRTPPNRQGSGVKRNTGDVFSIGIGEGNWQAHFFKRADVFNHAPRGLVKAVFNRIPHSRETFQFDGMKAKKLGSSVASMVRAYFRSELPCRGRGMVSSVPACPC